MLHRVRCLAEVTCLYDRMWTEHSTRVLGNLIALLINEPHAATAIAVDLAGNVVPRALRTWQQTFLGQGLSMQMRMAKISS
jgi:hypothetical protein